MAVHDVKVPLYSSSGEDQEHTLFVDEFVGRIQLTIQKERDDAVELTIECYFDDLQRAWNAVKRY